MISVAYAADAAHHAPLAFYENPAFWVGLSFVMVVAFAFRPVSRALGAALDARAFQIRARIDDAVKLREDAQETLGSYQRKQRDAMKEAEAIIAHAKAEAERLAIQAAKDLEESVKRREQMAMDRIATAEAQALRDVRNVAVDVAIAAARQVLAETITADQAAKMVDGAITDLSGKLH
ncbi:MAG: F0F1 ATP synthase subunit B [Magnetospirillum sp.]|nr:F0F1 ATP synthase subunit B [Magnetospirillum sp.]